MQSLPGFFKAVPSQELCFGQQLNYNSFSEPGVVEFWKIPRSQDDIVAGHDVFTPQAEAFFYHPSDPVALDCTVRSAVWDDETDLSII